MIKPRNVSVYLKICDGSSGSRVSSHNVNLGNNITNSSDYSSTYISSSYNGKVIVETHATG